MQGAERAKELVGTVLAERYRLTGVLSESSAGATLRAEHIHMRHRVTVKVLYPEEAKHRNELLVQFEREALAGAHIEHDNVTAATDYGALPDGLRFLVMEYLEGPTLRRELSSGPLPLRRAIAIASQVARALGSMHARGIIHRALSPDAVRLVERGGERDVVKVVDFGSALLPTSLIADEADARRKTRIATPVRPSASALIYCSPELIATGEVDGRSDLYSLGVTLFELLLGAPPPARAFPVPSVRAVRGDAPAELDELLARLLAPNPDHRPGGADEVADALEDLMQGMRQASMPDRKAAAFVSAPTAYGSPSASAASAPTERPPPSAAASTAEVDGGWAPLAHRTAAEPRLPVPPVMWLTGGGALGIVLVIVGIVAVRSEPFPDGTTPSASAESAKTSSTDRGSRASDDDDDEGEPVPDGERPPAGGTAKPATSAVPEGGGEPLISLGGLDALKGDPPLGTPESLRVFEQLRQSRRMQKVQNAVVLLDKLLEMNPRAPEDGEVRAEVFELAQQVMIGNRPEADILYGWLSTRMGHYGPDILYQLVTTKGGSLAAKRAERALRDEKIRQKFSPQLAIAHGLRMGSECAEQPALIAAAGKEGDRRAYGSLIRLRDFCDRGGQCCREHYEALKGGISAMEKRGFR